MGTNPNELDDIFATYEDKPQPKKTVESKTTETSTPTIKEEPKENKPQETKPTSEQPVEAKKEEPKKEEPKKEEPKPEERNVSGEVKGSADNFFGDEISVSGAISVDNQEVEDKLKAEEKKGIPIPQTPKDLKFDTSEAKGSGKIIFTIFGLKGNGKTRFAMSFKGNIKCISFDDKSRIIRDVDYKKDPRIVVYDGIRYLDQSTPEKYLESCDFTFKYLEVILDEIKAGNDADWIIFDGAEIVERITEMVMRYRNNLMPFQGIANLNLWKERRMYVQQLHHKALECVRKGIIYTTYIDKDEVVVEGQTVTKKDVPRWFDAVMYFTDILIKVTSDLDQSRRKRYFAEIDSSKYPIFRNGAKKDVTDTGIETLLAEGAKL